MPNLIRLALSAAALGLTKASWAAVVMGSFAGTVYEGADGRGQFGAPGADLANAAISGTYAYDTALLASVVTGTVNTGSGVAGALQVTISIGGQSYTFDGNLGVAVALDSGSGELDLSSSNLTSGDVYDSFLLGFVPVSSVVTGTNLAQGFSTASLATSLGSFVIAGGEATNGNFTIDSVSQSVVASAVPEPVSLALLLPAVAGAAAARYRRQVSATR